MTHPWFSALGLQHALIQAPMAGSQGSALAVAVGRAGALGSLPAAMLSPQTLAQELQAVAQGLAAVPWGRTAGGSLCVNVNFFCHRPPVVNAEAEAAWRTRLAGYAASWGVELQAAAGAGREPFNAAMAEVLEVHRPAVVSFHFGLPEAALLQRVKALGARVLSSATTVEEARWLQAQGVDAVVAQGLEAGGHRGLFLSEDLSGQLGTMALVPQVVRAVELPVIAAGGIADAAGVRAARALGACGVQVGTAFLLCTEAGTSAVHRTALQQAARGQGPATALTNLFSGRPARGLMNRLMTELGPINAATPAFPRAAAALQGLRAAAEAQGVADFSPLWCGQNASGCREGAAAGVVAALMQEAGGR